MEESVSKRNKGLWYLIWGMVFVIVFGLSAYVGYRLMGTKKLPAPNAPSGLTFSELPVVTPTIGPAKPVTVAVVSELDDVQLEAQVDSVALGEWWSILGVDSQALPLKELGGYNWYTPTRLTIVLKDIRPLSKEERWGLYKPTASGPEAEPVAGLATEFDATSPEEIAYQIYVAPEVLVEGRAAEEIEESVNRQLFEVLYEGAVGSTAMTPDDYQAKRERVFPAEGEGTRIIRLKSTNNPAGAQSTRPGRFANEIAGWLEARLAGVKHWQLVPKAQAQTCGGNWKCGANWNECKCGNGDTCLQANDGKSCGTGRGTCTCNPICVQETGSLNSCSASYGVCRPPGGGSGNCSQCLALNTCYTNVNDDNNPPPGCGNGTCSNGETCNSCPADCGTCAPVCPKDTVTLHVVGDSGSVAPASSPTNNCIRKEFSKASGDSGCTYYWQCAGTNGSYGQLSLCYDKSCPIHIEGVDAKYKSCSAYGDGASASFSGNTCTVAAKNWTNGATVSINLLKHCEAPTVYAPTRNCSGAGTSVSLSWSNANCSKYRVSYSNGTSTFTTDVAGQSTTINNLAKNLDWTFKVSCVESNSCVARPAVYSDAVTSAA